MAKSRVPKLKAYLLTEDQKRTIGNVTKLLVQAECYLESDDVDNTMECYGDFAALYKQLSMTLSKAYNIMRSHNIAEQAKYLEETDVEVLRKEYRGGFTHAVMPGVIPEEVEHKDKSSIYESPLIEENFPLT